MIINPAHKLTGSVTVPGDKSISQRALLFAAMADGTSEITGLSDAADVCSMRDCLRQLGIEIEQENGKTIVHGNGLNGFSKPKKPLDCGNSGTAMRLLCGVLAGQNFDCTLIGDESLSKRPMRRIIDPLAQMGASITPAPDGTAPLNIEGRDLHPITYRLPVASAQVKSAVLLGGLYASGETTVIEPKASRDHTELMLSAMGVPVQKEGHQISIKKHPLNPAQIEVPGDISAAAFFLVAAAMLDGSEIEIKSCGLNPTRSYLLDVLEGAGVNISIENTRASNGERIADLRVKSGELQAFEVSGSEIPLIIDEIPILAILATQATGTTRIRDAAELRVKESDRIEAVEKNLRVMGVELTAFDDGFEITGPQQLRGATIETFHDHRIAMAFAIAGLIADGNTTIQNAEMATISFPAFYEALDHLLL